MYRVTFFVFALFPVLVHAAFNTPAQTISVNPASTTLCNNGTIERTVAGPSCAPGWDVGSIPPPPPPPVDPSSLAFTDVTSTLTNELNSVSTRFWAGMPDLNGDGCFDIFVGSHDDQTSSAVYLQGNSANTCSGSFTYLANNDNYTQANPFNPRITGRYAFGNWTGDSKGLWSFWGTDVDGNAAALYAIDNSTQVGGAPVYKPKTALCASTSRCLMIDTNGDGNLEIINSNRELDALRHIVDVQTGATTYPVNNAANDYHMLVFDIDNDTFPDIVNIEDGSAWRYNNGTSDFDLVNTHTVQIAQTAEGASYWPNHTVALDYDNDGDTDFMTLEAIYGVDGDANWYLFRNDGGTFTNVTVSAELDQLGFQNESFWTIYANAFVADMNLDGFPDILFAGSQYGRDLHIIMNDGDGTFSRWDDQDFGGGGGNGGKAWVYAADYDNDGDIDLVKADDAAGTMRLWRSDLSTTNNWLRVRPVGLGDNTDGLHTRIVVKQAGTNNIVTSYEVQHQQGNSGLIPHMGLGANATVDIDVTYPHGGPAFTLSNVSANQDIVIYRNGTYATYTPGSSVPLVASVPSNAVDTDITLIADTEITPTGAELVTFALPFAEGDVTNINELRVSIGGSEVAAYVEADLTHHWSDNSIRSATIQLQNVDMTGGDVTVNVTDGGAQVARLTEQPHANGWTNAGADKDNLPYPRIFAVHDTQYLADSGIIPPFTPAPETPDAFEQYQSAQFDNNFGGLDYPSSSGANWLFDRSSAMFKVYMTTGDVKFLKEAFLGKQFYFQHVRNDGTTPTAAGGDGCWTYGTVACSDGKYIAPQQAKLALALTGDDSQWDEALLVDMALQADAGWNQYGSRDAFDNENEGFTERGAGLTGLAEVVVYEITGDASILAHLNERIDSLEDMQQTEKSWDIANGWTPKSGGFTHNIDVHEGASNEGNAALGNTNARGFSGWMSENIADFLWQTYWITGNNKIPEMLRLLALAVDNYAFTSVYNAATGEHDELPEFTALADPIRAQACNTTREDTAMVYLTSAYADSATRTSGDWYPYYSDNHNIETVLILAAGYYFETDTATRTRLRARIDKLIAGWSNPSCAAIFSNVYRLFNWQHRSNSVRTWAWINGGSI